MTEENFDWCDDQCEHEDHGREELRARLNAAAKRERDSWPEWVREAHRLSGEAATEEARKIMEQYP